MRSPLLLLSCALAVLFVSMAPLTAGRVSFLAPARYANRTENVYRFEYWGPQDNFTYGGYLLPYIFANNPTSTVFGCSDLQNCALNGTCSGDVDPLVYQTLFTPGYASFMVYGGECDTEDVVRRAKRFGAVGAFFTLPDFVQYGIPANIRTERFPESLSRYPSSYMKGEDGFDLFLYSVQATQYLPVISSLSGAAATFRSTLDTQFSPVFLQSAVPSVLANTRAGIIAQVGEAATNAFFAVGNPTPGLNFACVSGPTPASVSSPLASMMLCFTPKTTFFTNAACLATVNPDLSDLNFVPAFGQMGCQSGLNPAEVSKLFNASIPFSLTATDTSSIQLWAGAALSPDLRAQLTFVLNNVSGIAVSAATVNHLVAWRTTVAFNLAYGTARTILACPSQGGIQLPDIGDAVANNFADLGYVQWGQGNVVNPNVGCALNCSLCNPANPRVTFVPPPGVPIEYGVWLSQKENAPAEAYLSLTQVQALLTGPFALGASTTNFVAFLQLADFGNEVDPQAGVTGYQALGGLYGLSPTQVTYLKEFFTDASQNTTVVSAYGIPGLIALGREPPEDLEPVTPIFFVATPTKSTYIEMTDDGMAIFFQILMSLVNLALLSVAIFKWMEFHDVQGFQLTAPQIVLALEVFGCVFRFVYWVTDPLVVHGIYNSAANNVMLTLWVPFTFATSLFLSFYWWELVSAATKVILSVDKLKIPFIVLFAGLLIMEIVLGARRAQNQDPVDAKNIAAGVYGTVSIILGIVFLVAGLLLLRQVRSMGLKGASGRRKRMRRLSFFIYATAAGHFFLALMVFLLLSDSIFFSDGGFFFILWTVHLGGCGVAAAHIFSFTAKKGAKTGTSAASKANSGHSGDGGSGASSKGATEMDVA